MAKQRSIFEDVGTTEKQSVETGLIDRGRSDARGAIRVWLLMLFALVVVMIAVGGLTRLTDSGLSITEWRPITGSIPPLSAADWETEFDKYKSIDEWRIQNQWMTMADFKVIYWWEWGHRQLGRVIGLVWALGFFWFLLRGQIPSGRAGLALPGVGWLAFVAVIGFEVAKLQGALTADQAYWGEITAMGLMALMCVACVFSKSLDWTARLLFWDCWGPCRAP